jgi:hypothetical protein
VSRVEIGYHFIALRVRVPPREQIFKTNKMGKEENYREIILQTSEWFDKKSEQLKFIIENPNDAKILFQSEDGERVELPNELKKGFYFGIQTAIEVFGEFPVKITKTNDSN